MENYIERASQRDLFLKSFFNNSKFSTESIQGDAGLREYYRIKSDNQTGNQNFILMDCPPSYTNITPFVNMANYLNDIGLIAPQIYATDYDTGFILLQDFGTQSAGDFIENLNDINQKLDFYKLSIDILCELQKHAPDNRLSEYSDELLISELEIFLKWYMPYTNESANIDASIEQFRDIWKSLIKNRPAFKQTTVLRDYHVQNIMILNQNHNIKSLGLLDFQDAVVGSPIYDVVSILEDARINVPRDLAIKALKYYSTKAKLDYDDVMLEYSILGAQRNIRILGIFARKAMRDKDTGYLNFIPTVMEYIQYDLSHPALSVLSEWANNHLKQIRHKQPI